MGRHDDTLFGKSKKNAPEPPTNERILHDHRHVRRSGRPFGKVGKFRNRVYVNVPVVVRFAIWRVMRKEGLEHATASYWIITLLTEALAARGWSEDRMRSQYVRYAEHCRRTGTPNLFPDRDTE